MIVTTDPLYLNDGLLSQDIKRTKDTHKGISKNLWTTELNDGKFLLQFFFFQIHGSIFHELLDFPVSVALLQIKMFHLALTIMYCC